MLYFLQKKPQSKRGPPGLQKRGNASDWQVKDRQEAALGREEEQEEETQTVIRYNLSTFRNSIHYRLCTLAAAIRWIERAKLAMTHFALEFRCCRNIIVQH